MRIKKLYLKNYRNFDRKLLEFSDDITVIVGPNASGKTNILEATNLLSTGKSFHARKSEEMITYDEEIARVKGLIGSSKGKGNDQDKDDTKLEVILTRGEVTVGEDPEKTKKARRKRVLLNGVGKRLYNFAGNLKIVLFGPWDLDLVTESPSTRRSFLDSVISQVDREYRRASLSYGKGLRQRNKLLYRIREEDVSRSQLLFWDKLLIKNGNLITNKREEFIEFVNETSSVDHHEFSLEYDRSVISEARIEQYQKEEVAAATTLVGPHRDDFIFKVKDRDSERVKGRELDKYGSRGEQRMGVLWIKLAELAYVEEESEETPVLLLDDIFSELDHEHRDVVMTILSPDVNDGFDGQVIITTADPHYLEGFKEFDQIELDG